ncbi:hypothetical protein M5689_006465 [Euphorbia peplus]|nr:hypothetical protein M5689_006465 [Euphorbia peplus]
MKVNMWQQEERCSGNPCSRNPEPLLSDPMGWALPCLTVPILLTQGQAHSFSCKEGGNCMEISFIWEVSIAEPMAYLCSASGPAFCCLEQ